MAVRIHPHARQRLSERGATAAEVTSTVRGGVGKPAKFGRTEFVRRFPYDRAWLGQAYATKEVHAFAAPEGVGNWLVITVIVKFF